MKCVQKQELQAMIQLTFLVNNKRLSNKINKQQLQTAIKQYTIYKSVYKFGAKHIERISHQQIESLWTDNLAKYINENYPNNYKMISGDFATITLESIRNIDISIDIEVVD